MAKRDQAVDLFNELKLSKNQDEKVDKIKQLTELIVHVERTLLPEFVPEICALQLDGKQNVRKQVAEFLEKLASLPPSLLAKAPFLPLSVSTLAALQRDQSDKVAKRASTASNTLFSALYRACVRERKIETLQACWDGLLDLKASAKEILLSDSAKAGFKVYLVKYLECVVNFLSEDALKRLCVNEAALYAKFEVAARDASETVFQAIASMASKGNMSGPHAIVLLNAVASFTKKKPSAFASKACETLTKVASSLRDDKDKSNSAAGLLQSLKQTLLGLAKDSSLVQYGVRDVCTAALSTIGFDSLASQFTRSSSSSSSSSRKRADPRDPRASDPRNQGGSSSPQVKRQRHITSDMFEPTRLLAEFTKLADQINGILASNDLKDFEGPLLSPEATADAVISNFGLNPDDFTVRSPAEEEEVEEEGRRARSAAEALMDTNLAAIHEVNSLTREDIKFMSLESLKRIFAANLENISQPTDNDEMSIQDQLLARIVVILLGNFWDRDRSYCESVLNSLVNHILDKMQRDRGHATSMGLFYAIFSLGESFRSIYNSLLLKLVKGMREKLPPHDTALCKLMMEVPILPQNEIVVFLRNMIIMSSDKEGDDEALEWASLGLSTLRDLVFERPSLRRSCLTLSLTCAMHKNQVLRTKAIKLVATTLYPVAYLQGDIEQFALKALRQLTTAGDVSSQEVSRHMELFFALCTKKHDLLHELLSMFARASKVQKQVMNQNVSSLAKEIPPTSPSVLMVVESPPRGSEILLLLMLHSMAEANPLPKQLVRAVQALYRKNGDARFLVPIFADMPKADANEVLHKFVELPETARKTAILNAFSNSPEGRSPGSMSASELFVGLHLIDEAKHGIPLKKMIECTNLCFQMKEIFTAKVLSVAIQKLVQYTPLPKLFMRTIIIIKKEEKLSNQWLISMLTSIYSKLRDDNRQWQGFLMFYKGLDETLKEKLKDFVNQK